MLWKIETIDKDVKKQEMRITSTSISKTVVIIASSNVRNERDKVQVSLSSSRSISRKNIKERKEVFYFFFKLGTMIIRNVKDYIPYYPPLSPKAPEFMQFIHVSLG